MKLNNLINKAIFDIEFATKSDHVAFTKDLELDKEILIQLIDQELNQIDADIKIDKLTLTFPEQGFSNYKEVKSFLQKSIREEVLNSPNSLSSLEINQTLEYHNETGVKPWWFNRNLSLKNSIESLKNINNSNLIEIAKKVLVSKLHFTRFKNSISQKIYKQFLERLLSSQQHAHITSFLKISQDLYFSTNRDLSSLEYLILKKEIVPQHSYTESDIQLIAHLSNNSNYELANLTKSFEFANSKEIFDYDKLNIGQTQSQLYQDPIVIFISFLEIKRVNPLINFTFLELQLAALNKKRKKQLTQNLIYNNTLQRQEAIDRLFIFSQQFVFKLLNSLITSIHGRAAAEIFSFFISKNKTFNRTEKIAQFLNFLIGKKTITKNTIYDFVIESHINTSSGNSFLSNFLEESRTETIYLNFKNFYIQKSLNIEPDQITRLENKSMSQNMNHYISQGSYIKQIIESLGYSEIAEQKALDNIQSWSPTSSKSLLQFFRKLGLNKNQMINVIQKIWYDITKKINLTKRDQDLLKELNNVLLESAFIISDKEKASKIINEVIFYKINASNKSQLKDLLSSHSNIIRYIDEASFSKILSVLNNDSKIVIIYNRVQDLILRSGQSYLINSLRSEAISIISSQKYSYDNRKYTEKLLKNLFKSKPTVRHKIISSLSSKYSTTEKLLQQKNHVALAALFTLSSFEREQVMNKDWNYLREKLLSRKQVKSKITVNENNSKARDSNIVNLLSNDDLNTIWSNFEGNKSKPLTQNNYRNTQNIIRGIKSVLQDKLSKREVSILLKLIKKSDSNKDLKTLIDFIETSRETIQIRESKSMQQLNKLQYQIPEIDIDSLRLKIGNDKNAVNQLRLLFNELLANEREFVMNEQSLILSDRFEYLIQRSDTLEPAEEKALIIDQISFEDIRLILQDIPINTTDGLRLAVISNNILEDQITEINTAYLLKLSELWKAIFFDLAFEKSVKRNNEVNLHVDQFLSQWYFKTSQKIKESISSIDSTPKNLASIESKISSIIKEKIEVFINNKTDLISKSIYQLVKNEISAVKLESNSNFSTNEIHITEKDIQHLFASLDISSEKSSKLTTTLKVFIKNLKESIQEQFEDILAKKLTFSLQNPNIQINNLFGLLHSPVNETDIATILKVFKSMIPLNEIDKITNLLLELIDTKKQGIIKNQRSILAQKMSLYFTTGSSINEIFNSTRAIKHNYNFQEEIASLQLEKKHGATQAIRIKNYLKQLIVEKRTVILNAQNRLLALQLEASLQLESNKDFSSLETTDDLNFKISKEEQANLPLKDAEQLEELASRVNQILKQEQIFIEQGLLEGVDERLKNFIYKTETTDINKKPMLSMEDILSSKKSLLLFINNYANSAEVMTLFSKLSLQSEHNKLAINTFNQVISSISKIEKVFITLNTRFGISNVSESILKQFVRVELVQSLNMPAANSKIIAFNIIEKLRSLNLLQPITEKLISYNTKNATEKEVISGIKLYLEEDEFNFIDRKIENEFYFNDLYFHLLANDKLPFWAKNTSYAIKDAIKYFHLKIINKNSDYVASWLENKSIKKTITAHFLKLSIDSQIALIEAVEINTTTRLLSTLFRALIPKTSDLQINLNKVFQEIIEKNIYKSKNQQDIIEKIITIVSNNDYDVREVLITHFGSLNISLTASINSNLGNEVDIPTLVGYYVIDKKHPSMHLPSFQAEKTSLNSEQVLITLSSALKDNPEEIIKVLKNEITDTNSLKNLMLLLEKKDLINSIKTEHGKLTTSLQVLVASVLEELQSQDKTSIKFIAYLNVIVYLLKVTGKLKRSNFNEFYRLIRIIDNRSWTNIQASILISLEKEKAKNPTHTLDKKLIGIQDLVKSKSIEEIDPWKTSIEYYINYGSLPSDNLKVTLSDLSTNLERLLTSDTLTWKVKAHHWARRKSKIAHLLSLYTDDQKGTLLTIIHPDLKKDLSSAIDLIHSLEPHGVLFNKPLRSIDDILYEVMAIWSTTFVYSAKSDPIIGSFLHRNVAVSSTKADKIEEVIEAMIKKSTRKKTLILRKIKADVIGKISLKEKQSQQAKKDIPTDLKQGITISNSGLILAWPFITTLFNKIGLLEKNKFIDYYSQQKGVLLTQYLTNFSTDFEESDLALNKLLCGLEISDVVDVTLELSDYEKETAAFLLNAIIQNWEKLNKTSVQTLQETFLQREGILERFEKDYKLHVSSKAFDLLLKTIPWNISMIQTTFMKNRILVEWNY